MASIGLTTLANCKTLLGIPSGDTSADALLTLLIQAVSKQIETFIDRKLATQAYVQLLGVNNRQLLQMEQWPITTVTFVKEGTVTLVADQDYLLLPQYLQAGQIYRGAGWVGPAWVRGLTADPYAGQLILTVSYTAGYVLPGDTAVPGVESLPMDLQLAAMQMVCKAYGLSASGNIGQNLSSIKEGGLAYSYETGGGSSTSADIFGVISGMPAQFASLLNPYRRWAVA